MLCLTSCNDGITTPSGTYDYNGGLFRTSASVDVHIGDSNDANGSLFIGQTTRTNLDINLDRDSIEYIDDGSYVRKSKLDILYHCIYGDTDLTYANGAKYVAKQNKSASKLEISGLVYKKK